MTDDDLLKLDNQLCHRFYSVSNALTRAYRPLLQKMDITYPQYLVLLALWEHKQLTISALVDKCRIDAGALTLILKKLEQKGYLAITPSTLDKRVKQVVLTGKGSAARNDAAEIPKALLCHIKNLSMDELQMLTGLIDKLYCDLTHS
ncbi:MarR family winged helix-turn-helix transcriptional regulator [Alteromonas lipolytica]|uniref:Transcriptional regulator n=1 Tax=Alteromonas lipolytica TaxID=1856405 RepID=A0A1E8FE61_9ALTE|nr:MarR family transcriptional regulator [Alteromonas lipolytica]OFI33878.1 transcriptional regulator [Alteromonas lipolytica]GGF67577.1 MarR family transcriptional regulator [Alteromonas lipolytica]